MRINKAESHVVFSFIYFDRHNRSLWDSAKDSLTAQAEREKIS